MTMKKPDWSKVMKTIGIIAAIAAVILYFYSKSQREYKERDNMQSGIVNISEELRELSYYAEDSKNYSEEDMQVSLYHLQEECKKLSDELEDLSHYFDEPEIEENRRSWCH